MSPKNFVHKNTQNVTKLENSKCDKTQTLEMWQNSKGAKTKKNQDVTIQSVTKLKKIKMWQLKNSKYDKTQKFKIWQMTKCDKTQKLKMWQKSNCDNLRTQRVTRL